MYQVLGERHLWQKLQRCNREGASASNCGPPSTQTLAHARAPRTPTHLVHEHQGSGGRVARGVNLQRGGCHAQGYCGHPQAPPQHVPPAQCGRCSRWSRGVEMACGFASHMCLTLAARAQCEVQCWPRHPLPCWSPSHHAPPPPPPHHSCDRLRPPLPQHWLTGCRACSPPHRRPRPRPRRPPPAPARCTGTPAAPPACPPLGRPAPRC